MSLMDMRSDGRWSANMYKILRRYLDANIGKSWSGLYSKLCSVADAETHLGHELRRAIQREVDEHDLSAIETYRRGDWFVDTQGRLQKYSKESWKQKWKARKATLPIERIYFEEDGSNVYYELTEVSEGPRASKYSKLHKLWFRVTRTIETYTRVVSPEEAAARSIGVKKGKKDFYKEYTHEKVDRLQVGGSVLPVLRAIADKHSTSTHKIIKLVHSNSREEKQLTAVVSGSSIK